MYNARTCIPSRRRKAIASFLGSRDNYTVEKRAARIGKRPQDVAERLKLLDLTEPVANAFVAGHIGLGHALLIAKLAADVQEKALAHCFDGYYPANDIDRGLVPASRLQAWIAQNIYLSLKSVPFSKDDETRSDTKPSAAYSASTDFFHCFQHAPGK
jgi:ParB family transcriptional regulator, chromosome partitioning protein